MASASPHPQQEQLQKPAPLFRRPTRNDAVELARAAFLRGERVDMQQLASQLDVSRVTIFRWVGSREQLLERLLDGLTSEFVANAREHADGSGEDRVLDFVRRVMTATAHFEPARKFVAREPQLALRLLLAEEGVVHRRLAEGLQHVLADAGFAANAGQLKSFVDVLVQVGTALEWATLVIGDDPQIERTVEIGRALLQAATRQPARRSPPRKGKRTKRSSR